MEGVVTGVNTGKRGYANYANYANSAKHYFISCFLSSSRPEDKRTGEHCRRHRCRRGQRGRPGNGGRGGERGHGERIRQRGE